MEDGFIILVLKLGRNEGVFLRKNGVFPLLGDLEGESDCFNFCHHILPS